MVLFSLHGTMAVLKVPHIFVLFWAVTSESYTWISISRIHKVMQFTNAAWQDGPFNKPAVWYCCPPMVTVPVGSSWEESELPASPLSRSMILSVTTRQLSSVHLKLHASLENMILSIVLYTQVESYLNFHFKKERELKLSYSEVNPHPLLLSCWLSSLTEPYLIFLLHLIH